MNKKAVGFAERKVLIDFLVSEGKRRLRPRKGRRRTKGHRALINLTFGFGILEVGKLMRRVRVPLWN